MSSFGVVPSLSSAPVGAPRWSIRSGAFDCGRFGRSGLRLNVVASRPIISVAAEQQAFAYHSSTSHRKSYGIPCLAVQHKSQYTQDCRSYLGPRRRVRSAVRKHTVLLAATPTSIDAHRTAEVKIQSLSRRVQFCTKNHHTGAQSTAQAHPISLSLPLRASPKWPSPAALRIAALASNVHSGGNASGLWQTIDRQ